jgi:ribosomal protein S4
VDKPTLAQLRAGLERKEQAERALLAKLAAATLALKTAQRLEQRLTSEAYKAGLLVKVARARVEAAEQEATDAD